LVTVQVTVVSSPERWRASLASSALSGSARTSLTRRSAAEASSCEALARALLLSSASAMWLPLSVRTIRKRPLIHGASCSVWLTL